MISVLVLSLLAAPSAALKLQPPTVKTTGNSYVLILSPQLESAAAKYVDDHPGIRLATFTDTREGDEVRKMMAAGEIQFPYALWKDLNRDGLLDVVLVFISKKVVNQWAWHDWFIVAFHGTSAATFVPVAITKTQGSCLDSLVPHKADDWVEFSCFGVAAGAFRWNGKTYQVKAM